MNTNILLYLLALVGGIIIGFATKFLRVKAGTLMIFRQKDVDGAEDMYLYVELGITKEELLSRECIVLSVKDMRSREKELL